MILRNVVPPKELCSQGSKCRPFTCSAVSDKVPKGSNEGMHHSFPTSPRFLTPSYLLLPWALPSKNQGKKRKKLTPDLRPRSRAWLEAASDPLQSFLRFPVFSFPGLLINASNTKLLPSLHDIPNRSATSSTLSTTQLIRHATCVPTTITARGSTCGLLRHLIRSFFCCEWI